VIALHHVQVACPPHGEEGARRFYAWFRAYDERGAVAVEVHVGVEDPFVPARKAHPAFVVDDLAAVSAEVRAAGFDVDERERTSFEGHLRFHTHDTAGNRVEVLQRV
jgi:catechol 2,3-dioxygenase-like lactoylglutathione lyase family enzyme